MCVCLYLNETKNHVHKHTKFLLSYYMYICTYIIMFVILCNRCEHVWVHVQVFKKCFVNNNVSKLVLHVNKYADLVRIQPIGNLKQI